MINIKGTLNKQQSRKKNENVEFKLKTQVVRH